MTTKKFISTFTIFLLAFLQTVAQQNSKAIYTLKAGNELSQTKSDNPIVQQLLLSFSENSKDAEYALVFNKTESYFFLIDKKELKIENQTEFDKLQLFNYSVYTNLVDKIIIKQPEPIEQTTFLIKTEFGKQQWELTSEEKLIDGYKCFKAILKNDVNQSYSAVAWYAPEIPYSYGPIEYNNLPGLILELTLNENFTFYLTQLNLNSKENIRIDKPEKGKVVTQTQYQEELKKYTDKMMDIFKN